MTVFSNFTHRNEQTCHTAAQVCSEQTQKRLCDSSRKRKEARAQFDWQVRLSDEHKRYTRDPQRKHRQSSRKVKKIANPTRLSLALCPFVEIFLTLCLIPERKFMSLLLRLHFLPSAPGPVGATSSSMRSRWRGGGRGWPSDSCWFSADGDLDAPLSSQSASLSALFPVSFYKNRFKQRRRAGKAQAGTCIRTRSGFCGRSSTNRSVWESPVGYLTLKLPTHREEKIIEHERVMTFLRVWISAVS